jgi:hypothetical protein
MKSRYLGFIYLFLLSSNAYSVGPDVPSGQYTFHGDIGFIGGIEKVYIQCMEYNAYDSLGFTCERPPHDCKYEKPVPRPQPGYLACTRSGRESEFYRGLLPSLITSNQNSKLILEEPNQKLQFVEEKYGMKVWKVSAGYTYKVGNVNQRVSSYFYFQSKAHPDQINVHWPMTQFVFHVAGPNQVWIEETAGGESKDEYGHIVANRVTAGAVLEKEDPQTP